MNREVKNKKEMWGGGFRSEGGGGQGLNRGVGWGWGGGSGWM